MVSAELKYDTETDPDSFDGVAWAMQESWGGIFVAGVAFSLVYLLGIAVWLLAHGLISLGGFLGTLILVAVFPVIGLLLTMFWSIFAFVFVLVLNMTVWETLNRRTAVAIFGGASGFLATYWQIFDWANLDLPLGIFRLVGVAIAGGFGQAGALYWGNRRNVFFERTLPVVPDDEVSNESTSSTDSATQPVPRFQFGIKQMLAATVLFGLLFTANRMVPRHEVLVMAGVYTVFQLIFLGLDRAQLFLRARKPSTA